MRKAVIISLVAHGLAMLIVFVSVSFRQVRYLPRETYRVRIVTAAAAQPTQPAPEPPAPKATPKEEPKDDELAAPVEKPKPKPKSDDDKSKQVPRAQITKSDTAATAGDTLAAASGEAVPEGISFDGGDFPYHAFIARMRHKIAAAWQVPAGSEGVERFAVIYFRVHRDGNITHVSVERGSGVFLFDQSCQRAVIQAAPFPPLPREYDNEYVGVHFSFKFVPAAP